MPLKLMYITNSEDVAHIAEEAGVDRIFDMGRTTVNITGDASCSIIVSNLEKRREAKLAKEL